MWRQTEKHKELQAQRDELLGRLSEKDRKMAQSILAQFGLMALGLLSQDADSKRDTIRTAIACLAIGADLADEDVRIWKEDMQNGQNQSEVPNSPRGF